MHIINYNTVCIYLEAVNINLSSKQATLTWPNGKDALLNFIKYINYEIHELLNT